MEDILDVHVHTFTIPADTHSRHSHTLSLLTRAPSSSHGHAHTHTHALSLSVFLCFDPLSLSLSLNQSKLSQLPQLEAFRFDSISLSCIDSPCKKAGPFEGRDVEKRHSAKRVSLAPHLERPRSSIPLWKVTKRMLGGARLFELGYTGLLLLLLVTILRIGLFS